MRNKNILYPELSYKLNGLFFETHNALGRYRNERQCCDYFEKLLIREKMHYVREYVLPPSFEGERFGRNRIDFMIKDLIVVDFKTETFITKEDYFQMRRYLEATDKELGIIVNFRQKSIKPKRVLNPKKHKK